MCGAGVSVFVVHVVGMSVCVFLCGLCGRYVCVCGPCGRYVCACVVCVVGVCCWYVCVCGP